MNSPLFLRTILVVCGTFRRENDTGYLRGTVIDDDPEERKNRIRRTI
jgi:hypothetical protein